MADPHISQDHVGAEQHVSIDVDPYNSQGDRSYLRIGEWEKSNAGVVNAQKKWRAYQEETPADLGDDLLAAFVDTKYLDDGRDRGTTVRAPTSSYDALAAQPWEPDPIGGCSTTDRFNASDRANHGFTEDERKKMTDAIPGNVGWRDHTEGHRITTTRGDKVEVIGGNYKLIVLGRGQGTASSDWSGGFRVDSMEAPGSVTSINYRRVPVLTGRDDLSDAEEHSWQWVEETIKGNVIERFHGTYREEFYGDEMISIVGRLDTKVGGVDVPRVPNKAAADKKGSFNRDMLYDGTLVPDWDDVPTGVVAEDNKVKLLRPAIKERVHASRIYSNEVITGQKIDVETAKNIHDYVGCTPELNADLSPMTAKVSTGDPLKFGHLKKGVVTAESWDARPEEIASFVQAASVSDVLECDSMSLQVGKFKRPVKTSEKWLGDFTELFDGNFQQLFYGLSTTFGIANRFELFIGIEEQITIGGLYDFALAIPVPNLAVNIGTCFELGAGIQNDDAFSESRYAAATSLLAIGSNAAHFNRLDISLAVKKAAINCSVT